jgi:hypothetical protein
MLKVGTTEAVKLNNDRLKTMKQFLYLLRPTRVGMLTQGPTPFEKENDPAVAEGVMFAELFPYKVALMRKL